MTPTECGVVCAARRARTPNTPLAPAAANDLCAAEPGSPPGARRVAGSCFTRGGVVRIRRFCRFVRFVRVGPITRSSERGPAARRDAGAGGAGTHSIAGDPDGRKHDCRDPRLPAPARGRGGGRGTAGPRGSAERRRGARTNRNRSNSGDAHGARDRPSNFRGRDDAAGTHRNYTTRINLLYSNVQLRTAQCTSRSPIQASSPDS